MKKIKFDDFVRLNRGFDLPDSQIVEGIYPVVASTNIKAYHNQYKIDPPVVVTGRSGSLGQVQYIDQKCWPLNTSLYSKDFRGNHPKYVYYYLQMMHLEQYNAGAGVPTLNQNHLHNLKILVHGIEEQKRIASILSAYDTQIENNQKRIKLLEQMAENLYKEWFVRFRFPGFENAEFEGGVPKGWNVEKLKKFITFYRGKSYSSDDISSGDYVLLSMNNIRPWGGYIRDDSRVYGGSFKDFQLIHKGDLIMSITDMTQDRRIIGYVGIFDEERDDCIMSTHLMKVVSEYNNYYLYGLFNFSLSRNISEYATGANVLGLTDKILKEIKALVPPEKLISQYGKMVRPVWEEIFHLKDEIANLTKQRDLLLPRLISGKLRI